MSAAGSPGRRGTLSRTSYAATTASLAALIALTLAWELWLAPLRPGGSWLALKALPLLAPLPGILKGAPYTYRWALMLVLAYVAEGCVRAYSETPPASTLAVVEVLLATIFFVSAITYLRSTGRPG